MQLKLPERTTPYIAAVFLFIIPFLVYWPLWLHPQAMAYDMADYFLPFRHFIGECLQHYQFPWWNPYSGLGIPIGADPQSGAFYPITWIIGYLFGYDFFTINLDYLLHIVIAGWGMYALLRGLRYPVIVCLLLASSYQYCGFFVNNAQHFSWIISAAWIPFFFHYYRLTFLKGNFSFAIKTALSLFMITTGGYPAFLIILLYLIGGHYIFFLTRNSIQKNKTALVQSLKWTAVMLFIYLVVTTPYFISFLEGIPLMTRGEALMKDQTSFRPFTPQSAITFLLPAVPLGHPVDFGTDTSMTNVYIGLLTLIFFITGIITSKTSATRILLGLTLLFLLIAFGDAFPLWSLLFDYAPLFDHIRFPSGFRLFVIIGVILITAQGMSHEKVLKSNLPFIVSAAVLLLLIAISIVSFSLQKKVMLPNAFSTEAMKHFFGESSIANNIVLQSVIQAVLLMGMLLLLFSKQRWQGRYWYFFLVALGIADLFIASRINFPVIMGSNFSATELNQKISVAADGFPMWDAATELEVTSIGHGDFAPSYFNNNLFTKQFSRDSYSPFFLKLRSELERSPEKFALMDHPVIYLTNKVQAYPAKPADDTQLRTHHTVLVHDSVLANFNVAATDSLKEKIQLNVFGPAQFDVTTFTDQKALLVLQQTYYPGWKVKVDGKITNPFITNFCMMSVVLNEGKHQVIFYYHAGLRQWILIASTCLLLLFIVFLFFSQMRINRGNDLNSRRE
ncbi:MAG: YfhO family protein [Chitinophagales bacterium]